MPHEAFGDSSPDQEGLHGQVSPVLRDDHLDQLGRKSVRFPHDQCLFVSAKTESRRRGGGAAPRHVPSASESAAPGPVLWALGAGSSLPGAVPCIVGRALSGTPGHYPMDARSTRS